MKDIDQFSDRSLVIQSTFRVFSGGGNKEPRFGDEVWAKADQLILLCPIERGIVSDWDVMEKIW
jgi:actin-related protein